MKLIGNKQMDNCARENKNRHVFGYCTYLIQCLVFDTIEMSFLPVGHTHEDIDQMFSRFSTYFRDNDAITVSCFMEKLQLAYKPTPKVSRIYEVANFKGIMETNKYLEDLNSFIILNFKFNIKFKKK